MSARAMHVVICNERLLPRFGVDRLLLLIGAALRRRGHRVTFLCQRWDRAAVEAVSPAIVPFTPSRGDIAGAEDDAAQWLDERWTEISRDGRPDVLITGGWPFFGAAHVCARRGTASVFIDAGAVPHDGLSEGAVLAQRAVRRVRAAALPRFTAVLPISRFILETQTLPDRGTGAGVQPVLLGADHLAASMFAAPRGTDGDEACLRTVLQLEQEGHRLVMLLGRFEAEGYKNSPAALDILSRMLVHQPKARLLVLAEADELPASADVGHAIVPLGYIGDAALNEVMARCDLGLSVSLWEGFNLPLAEMQWCGRPVLAFNVGAHPEVTCDPWFLCGTPGEMADKAVSLLQNGLPPHAAGGEPFERFRRRFRWDDVTARYIGIIERLSDASRAPEVTAAAPRRPILVDCTSAAIDPANPGVIRVVRRMTHALQSDPELLLLFARWDSAANSYRMLMPHERATLATFDGPFDGVGELMREAPADRRDIDGMLRLHGADRRAVLFIPEVILDGRLPERIVWAHARQLPIAAVLYDLIPVTHAPFCAADVVSRFPEYLEGLAAVDAIWAISEESLRQFHLYAARHALPRPPQATAIWLPAQFGAQRRETAPVEPLRDGQPITVLCVGSIEPRKNHRNLLAGFRALLERRPDLPMHLVLAGHRFSGSEELSAWVEEVCRQEPRITWTGLISDDTLAALFRRSAFTVYPSLVEGFGLPVVESLWMARPVLCHHEGVMAELARGGGCITVDMGEPAAIADGLERLADDAELRWRLSQEAVQRDLLDWTAYAAAIATCLRDLAGVVGSPPGADSHPSRSDSGLQALTRRMREEADTLRGLTERFVAVTDVSVHL